MSTNTNSAPQNGALSIEELAQRLPAGRPLLGLDPGTKTIGLALSDGLHTIASPLETIRRRKFREDAAALKDIVTKHQCAALIIGLPLNMDGSQGPRAQSVQALARNLVPVLQLPFCFWDERLSTVAVERALLEADSSRKRRAEVIDKMAAAYIMQGALDRMAQIGADRS